MIDCVFIADTTGSMASCIREVRRKIDASVGLLLEKLPDLKVGIIMHGDYCDRSYMLSKHDFTNDVKSLSKFIDSTGNTGGGDAPECYEYALHVARTEFSWRKDSYKYIIWVADDSPHSKYESSNQIKHHNHSTLNKDGYDFEEELKALSKESIHVYAVHCLGRSHSKKYYKKAADLTNGVMVPLSQFSDINDTLLAIHYHTQGEEQLETYAKGLQESKGISRSLANVFESLMPGKGLAEKLGLTFKDYSSVSSEDLKPVDPARFQVLDVMKDQDIKSFVLDTGAMFKTGKGFYEWTKSEEIQERKEVVLVERVSGDMWSGAKAREMINLPLGERGTLSPKSTSAEFKNKYKVFIQSTSNNRKLIGGTKFLYEVDRI